MSGARVSALLTTAIRAAALVLPAGAGTGTGDSSSSRVSIFYYPWYSTPPCETASGAHWYVGHDSTPVLSTPYFPARGLYSSSNAKIVAAQMREIAASGVDTVIVSWWGFDSPEHERLQLVVGSAPPARSGDRNPAAERAYLAATTGWAARFRALPRQ